MKLIGPQTIQVQSLGRHQTGLTAEAGKAEAIGRITEGVSRTLGTLAGVSEDILMTNSKRQNEKRQLYNQKEESDFWEENGGVEFFDVDDIPSDVVTEGMRIGGRVASAEVLPQMYENHMRDAMERSSLIIENKKIRDDYMAQDSEVFEGRLQNIRDQAAGQIAKQNLLDQNINRKNAIENKRPDVARTITNQMDISDDERKFLHIEEDVEAEILVYEDLLLESRLKRPEINTAIEYLSRENIVYREDNGNLDSTSQLAWRNKLMSELARLDRVDKASESADSELIRSRIKAATANNLSGKLNSPDDLTRMMLEIDLHPARDKLKAEKLELLHASIFNDNAVMMSQLDEKGVNDYVRYGKSDLPSPYDEQLKIRLRDFASKHVKNLKNDMMQTAVDVGFIKHPVFVDVENGSPFEIARQIAQTRSQHDMAFQNFNESQGYLTKTQSSSLSARYNNMPVDDQMEFLGAVSAVLGRDSNIVFDQLRIDGTSSAQAIAGEAYVAGDITGSKFILSGDNIRKHKSVELKDLELDLDGYFMKEVGRAFSGNPSHYEAVKDSFKSAYIGLADARGVDFDNIKSESSFFIFTWGSPIVEKALVIATGGIIEQSDVKISSPLRGMPQSQWDLWLGELHSKSIDAMGGVNGISSLEFLDRIRSSKYSLDDTDNPGEYAVLDEDNMPIMNKDGKLFIFKYDAEYPKKKLDWDRIPGFVPGF